MLRGLFFITIGETTHYVYAGGQRVRKVCYDTATDKVKYERIYLGAHEIYREYDSSENLDLERITHHVSDDQGTVALIEVKTISGGVATDDITRTIAYRYQFTDHLDSACIEINEDQDVISYEEYYAFGATAYAMHTSDTDVSQKRYKYVHKERDDETGLYYYGARYYAAWLCRFVSVDPLKDKFPYYTTYQYAGNKPIVAVDLQGLQEDPKVENYGGIPYAQYFRNESPITMGIIEGLAEMYDETVQYFGEDLWKMETHINTAQTFISMTSNPLLLSRIDNAYGTNLLERKMSINYSIVETVKEIPTWGKYEWSKAGTKFTVGTAISFVGDKGASKLWQATKLHKITRIVPDLPNVPNSSKKYSFSPEFDNNPLPNRTFSQPFDAAKGGLKQLQSTFDDLAETHLLSKYRKLDPNLKAGYTGSFKTGKVGNPNKATFGDPIDLNKFDVDYWIESDILYKKFGGNLKADVEFRKILSETPGFEGLKPNKQGFSIKFKPSSK